MRPGPSPQSEADGFVLAGGRSSRMGRSKAWLELDGCSLASLAVNLLHVSGLTAAFAGGQPELVSLAPVIADDVLDQGPLSGICAALASMNAELGIFIPVDMPLLPCSLLQYLLRRACIAREPVTLASVNGFPQTFPAVLRRETLPTLQAELDAGRRGCYVAFQAASSALGQSIDPVPVEMLVQPGLVTHPRALTPGLWFLNVNTPVDLERACSMIA